jgi:hypothetical protein
MAGFGALFILESDEAILAPVTHHRLAFWLHPIPGNTQGRVTW